MNLSKNIEQWLHPAQRQRIRTIRKGSLRTIVYFHENGIDTASYSGAGERFDVL